jgi:hypothetical protein
MSRNILVSNPITSLAHLAAEVRRTQLTEARKWPGEVEVVGKILQIAEFLDLAKAAPGSAGIWISTNHSLLSFQFPEKVGLVEAQSMVTCLWSGGERREDVKRSLVERWEMRFNKRIWRCLCDEEGLIYNRHINPIVTAMRMAMNLEDTMKYGAGPIVGDVLIINNKCGW